MYNCFVHSRINEERQLFSCLSLCACMSLPFACTFSIYHFRNFDVKQSFFLVLYNHVGLDLDRPGHALKILTLAPLTIVLWTIPKKMFNI